MSNRLKAGAGKVCINPTQDMYPIPGEMSDFGLEPMQQMEPYDDMNCRAIAIDNGIEKVIFVTYELSAAPDFPDFYERISRMTGFTADNIFVMATHNHSSPRWRKDDSDPAVCDFAVKYERLLFEAGIEACKLAVASLRPAMYGYGETVSDINVNRNLHTYGNYWVEGRNAEGFCDKTLSIIKLVDCEGRLIAAFLNHATHATNIYMLKDVDHKLKTSGNFTGIACRFVEEHFGNGAVAMWTSGAAGNQNPFMSHGLQYEYPDGWTTQIQYPDGTGYMQMEYIGRIHGVDCCKGIEKISRLSKNMPIAHVVKVLELPTNECVEAWPPKDFSEFRNGGQGPRNYKEVPYGAIPAPARIPEMVPGKTRKLYLHLLTIGNIAILFANAEIFSQIGKKMKDASPYKNTIVVTHHFGKRCNYIFDKTSVDVRLPMAYGGVVPGGADDIILEGELDLFDEILDVQ